MSADETLFRLETVVEEIASRHDARTESHEMDDGTWLVSIETDEWGVTGSGWSRAQAYGDLIANAKSQDRA